MTRESGFKGQGTDAWRAGFGQRRPAAEVEESRSTAKRRGDSRLLVLFSLLFPLLAGCGTSELQEGYGRRNGPMVFASVNGTAVFAQMCENRGHTVFSWPVLSPRLNQRADCIVWFPDDDDPPKREARRWLERWLKAKPNRTLIYVGRHYDALSWYWQNVPLTSFAPADRKEASLRGKTARTELVRRMGAIPKSSDCEWFVVEGRYRSRPITTVEGEPDWVQAVDPAGLSMELNARMQPPSSADVLLASEGDAIVFRQRIRRSQLVVVANGSFLLNAPLSIHEHRRLAGKLCDEIGPPGQTIAFLESESGGPEISETDPSFGPRLGFEVFQIWPTNWILLHVCLLGIVLCFWRFPIFGRPLEPETESASDFGLHIDAVARLLERAGDTGFADARLQHYRQMTGIDTVPAKSPAIASDAAPQQQHQASWEPEPVTEGKATEPLPSDRIEGES